MPFFVDFRENLGKFRTFFSLCAQFSTIFRQFLSTNPSFSGIFGSEAQIPVFGDFRDFRHFRPLWDPSRPDFRVLQGPPGTSFGTLSGTDLVHIETLFNGKRLFKDDIDTT